MNPATTAPTDPAVLPHGDGETTRRTRELDATHTLESATHAFQLFDAGWRITYMNPAARRFWASRGMDPDVVLGKHFWDELFPKERESETAMYMRRAMEQRVAVEYDFHYEPWGILLHSRFEPLPDGGLANYFQDVTVTRRATAALLESEERFRRYFELGVVGMAITSPTKGCLAVNDRICEILGYSRDELLHKTWAEMTHPEDLARDVEQFQRVMDGAIDSYSLEKRWIRKDDQVIDGLISVSCVRRPDRSVDYFVSLLDDITERKRAEKALRERERNLAVELAAMARLQEVSTRLARADDFTSLLEEIVDAAIAITGADMGNIQLLDRESRVLRIVASRGFEAPFLEFFNAVHESTAACGTALERNERVVVDDVTTSPILTGTPALGVLLAAGVVAVQSTPLVTRVGRLVGMLSTHHRAPYRHSERDLRLLDLVARQAADWIERTEAEESVRRSEARYRSLVSQVKDYAIFSTDERGVVTTWNEGCQEVLGYTEKEFVGLDVAELYTAGDRAAGLPASHVHEAAAAGTARVDRWMLARGGRLFFAMGSTTALRDSGGRLAGFSEILRDMTSMKLAQDILAHRGRNLQRLVTERTDALEKATERLRISERMASLGTLAAGLGHDLGNLLLPLEIRVQLLKDGNLSPELSDHVTGIESCLQYLERLSSGLRQLATDPRDAPSTEPTEIGEWWAEVDILLKNVLPRGVTFEADFPRPECWVAIGRVSLTQAVLNLVQNAADALSERGIGHVRVGVDDDPRAGLVTVRVSDDGPGMTEDVARRCMEPYFTTKSRGLSTGLGLALAGALVAAAGGRVEIDSTVGVGTTVRLVLRGAIHAERITERAARGRKGVTVKRPR